MEETPCKESLKGFNQGYSLQRLEPGILRSIISGAKGEGLDYKKGLYAGKAEMILEMEREKYPNRTIPKRRSDIDRGR